MRRLITLFEGFFGLCLAMVLACIAFIVSTTWICPHLPFLWAGSAISALAVAHECARTAARPGSVIDIIDPRIMYLGAALICAFFHFWWMCFFILWLTHADTLVTRFLRNETERNIRSFPGAGLFSFRFSSREITVQKQSRLLGYFALIIAVTVFLSKSNTLTAAAVLCSINPRALCAVPSLIFLNTIHSIMKRNTLVRSKSTLLNLAQSSVFITDKNGTLTDGSTAVSEVIGYNGLTENEIISIAASIEVSYHNQISRAIIREAVKRHLMPIRINRSRVYPQSGCYAMIDGTDYQCGSALFMQKSGKVLLGRARDQVDALMRKGRTVVFLADGANVLGAIALTNNLRDHFRELVSYMRSSGHEIALLSADSQITLKALADQAGILQISGNMNNEEKTAAVGAYAHDRDKKVIAFTHSVEASDSSGVPVALLSMGPALCSHASVVIGSNDVLELSKARIKAQSAFYYEKWLSRLFVTAQLGLCALCAGFDVLPGFAAMISLVLSGLFQSLAIIAGDRKS